MGFNGKFNIGYQSKGLSKNATEESKAVVKETYYALKKRNKFFNFQLSFLPMQGHVSHFSNNERYETESVTKFIRSNDGFFRFCGLRYHIKRDSNTRTAVGVPVIRKLAILKSMLRANYSDSAWDSQFESLSPVDVCDIYSEEYFKNYKKNHKQIPNELTVSWYFAIAITLLFYVAMIFVLYKVSATLAIIFLSLNCIVVIGYLIFFMFFAKIN